VIRYYQEVGGAEMQPANLQLVHPDNSVTRMILLIGGVDIPALEACPACGSPTLKDIDTNRIGCTHCRLTLDKSCHTQE